MTRKMFNQSVETIHSPGEAVGLKKTIREIYGLLPTKD